ncbi:MAG: hypothetical protein LUC93_03160 [Planctomycetaceae bacterium]|nr:hypothetical protein [Planctomycetaceae bacterium]
MNHRQKPKLWFHELWLDAAHSRDETRRLRLPFRVLKFMVWIVVICILYPICLLMDAFEKIVYK